MRFFCLFTFIASVTFLRAQGRVKTMDTDSGRVVLHYFTTGQLSTKEWMDTDDRWGRSWAWDRNGQELISYQTRKIGGHASVEFSYHANGGISKAEISDAPDGGIQWYRSTTTFDEHGVKTGFTEQGQGNDGPIPGVHVRTTQQPEVTKPNMQEVVEEQRLFVNEVLAVNATKWPCVVVVQTGQPSPALKPGNYALQPGDTLRVGSYTMGEVFDDPTKHVSLSAQRPNGKGRKRSAMEVTLLQQKQVSREHRAYYFYVLPEGARLKITM